MVHYDHDCDLVEYHLFVIHFQVIRLSFDTQIDIVDIVGQVVNIMDQLQLLSEHGMIKPLLLSRWYLLHRDK